MFQKIAFRSAGPIAFALCLAANAPAEPLVVLDPIMQVEDELRPDALISGNWLVGVHARANRAQNVPQLYSYVPAEWGGNTVCVRVTGEKGRYSALYPYEVPGVWGGGLIEFNYPTVYPDHVKSIDHTNSGVALHNGDCATVSDTFAPVLWNALENPITTDKGEVQLVLNINAGRADSVFGEATLGEQVIEMSCEPTEARGVGFNYQCMFTAPGDRAGELKVEIERLRFGRAAPSRTATIQLFPPLAQ